MAGEPLKTPAKQKITEIPDISMHTSARVEEPAPRVKQVDQGDQATTKDSTRKWIAYIYVGSFLFIIGVTVFFMFAMRYDIDDIKDILLAESGVLSGPLGFIIGFYFKEDIERKILQ